MTDLSKLSREELLERAMTTGFPELIGQGKFVEGPMQEYAQVDYLALMSRPQRVACRCGHVGWFLFDEPSYLWRRLVCRKHARIRASKIHRAYRNKKRGW